MLRHKVSDAEASLPGGTSVTVQDDFSLVYGMFYALTAEGFSERQLADYAGLIQRELTDLDGVAGWSFTESARRVSIFRCVRTEWRHSAFRQQKYSPP